MYKPVVWEYARMVVAHNVLSKRRLARLVAERHVAGWDDPRLLTLAGLRRRGVAPSARPALNLFSFWLLQCWMPSASLQQCSAGALTSVARLAGCTSDIAALQGGEAQQHAGCVRLPARCPRRQAITEFCRVGGISRNAAEAHLHKLEHFIRAAADAAAPRALAVLRPLRLVLTNLPADHREEVAAKARPPARAPALPRHQALGAAWAARRTLMLNPARRTLRCERAPLAGYAAQPMRPILAARPGAVPRGLPARRSTRTNAALCLDSLLCQWCRALPALTLLPTEVRHRSHMWPDYHG